MSGDIMLKVERLTKTYPSAAGPLTVLREVSFAVPAGASLAVVGPSGSGKTTLLGLCAGLAATPLVWDTTWTLVPLLFPLAAIGLFTTVAATAQRGRGRGLIAVVAWGCVAAAAFGYWVYTLTPDELVIEFHRRFYKEELDTIVAWSAVTNLWAGSAIERETRPPRAKASPSSRRLAAEGSRIRIGCAEATGRPMR